MNILFKTKATLALILVVLMHFSATSENKKKKLAIATLCNVLYMLDNLFQFCQNKKANSRKNSG